MKKLYILLVFLSFLRPTFAQTKIYRGNFYTGIEGGVFTAKTLMITGELGKYASGGSGILVPYTLKIGYNYTPYLSLETGTGSMPINMVYTFEDGAIVGSNPLTFMSIPLRINGRIYSLNRQIDATVSMGINYVRTDNETISKNFQGAIITSRHVFSDTLAYRGSVDVLRKAAFVAEFGVGINWAMSRRFSLNVYGRQNFGLISLAKVGVSIQHNQEPTEKAEFISRGGGFNVGVGLKYNFKN